MKYIPINSKLRLFIPLLVAIGLIASSLHLHQEIMLYQAGISVSSADSHIECLLCDAVVQIQEMSENEFFVFFDFEFRSPETSHCYGSLPANYCHNLRAPPIPV
jgi:hypothetical protein